MGAPSVQGSILEIQAFPRVLTLKQWEPHLSKVPPSEFNVLFYEFYS